MLTIGFINGLPASPSSRTQIRYIITEASRDMVVSPDSSVISPKVYAVNLISVYIILWYPH